MSRLSDQVEAKIARANRAFRLSSRIIAATQQELESHGEWLDSHRASWAEEIERHRRLLNRKLAMRDAGRFAVSLLFAAPFALARALERRIESRSAPEPRASKAEPPFTREAALQRRLARIDGPPGATVADVPHVSPKPIAEPKAGAPLSTGKAPLSTGKAPLPTIPPPPRAATARPRTDRVSIRAVASLALLIVAAGMFRAICLGPTPTETARVAQEAAEPDFPARATLTVAKSPRKAEPKTDQPASHAGFALLDAAPPAEGLRARPQTIAEMIALTESLAASSDATEAAPPSLTEEPVAPKPAPKAKPKRKVAAREEPVPWWQQWSWIKVR